jgi:glycosyltransferase involved in cell wall biosynthesis
VKPVGLVTYTIQKAGITPLSNLLNILNQISDEVYLIITKDKEILDMEFDSFAEIIHEGGGNPIFRLIKIFRTQIKICLSIYKLKNVETLIFFMGGETLILPMIASKILHKRVYLALGASQKNMSNLNKDFFRFFSVLCKINFYFADKIIVYSKTLIKEWDLIKYRYKITIAPHHFIDLGKFSKIKEMDQRENLVGYIGRLSPEKGVLNLVKAIPSIVNEKKEINFSIIGNGKLMAEIEEYMVDNKLENNLNLEGWVNHDDLGAYLNDFKLLIVPSYTEGLPSTVLEAMSCGTPVLSTSVGSVPDIIKDHENGFLLNDNSIYSIKNGIIETLNYPDLNQISENGIRTTKSFTFKEAISRYKNILME